MEHQYIISNINNYKKTLEESVDEILKGYLLVIKEFLELDIIYKNPQLYKFLVQRGIETISSVFSILLYYTKNLNLTVYNCQQSNYLYKEYIEQISNDSNSHLKLSSKEVSMFIYKKTIFEINRKNIQSHDNDKNINKKIDSYINGFKYMLLTLLKLTKFNYDTKSIEISKIKELFIRLAFTYKSLSDISNVNILLEYLLDIQQCITLETYFEIVELYMNSKQRINLTEKIYTMSEITNPIEFVCLLNKQ
jgi:hypothetical protein